MITLAAQCEGIQSRKDGTMKIVFGTQELIPSEAGDLFSLNNKFCFVAIKPELFLAEEKKAIEEMEIEQPENIKSPAARLRSILYVLWKNSPEGFATFTLFYENKMEVICSHFKNKLPL